jgi:hypothetical protein
MVYKKYIKKGDKTYGPYKYSSKRVDGKVVSNYLGPEEKIKLGGLFVLLVITFALFGALLYFNPSSPNPTGKVALHVSPSVASEVISGNLNLLLSSGELLPSETEIQFVLEGQEKSFVLSDLISEESSLGEYYVEGKTLSGNGSGYGLIGEKREYSEVNFVLGIYEEESEISEESPDDVSGGVDEEQVDENSEEGNIDEEVVDDSEEEIVEEVTEDSSEEQVDDSEEEIVEEVTEDSSEEQVDENSEEENNSAPITGNVVGGIFGRVFSFFLNLKPTGKITSNLANEIEGSVVYGEEFLYELEEGQTAEIISSSQDVELVIEEGVAKVTTDYYVSEEGYGKNYSFGERNRELRVDLSQIGLYSDDGQLEVKLLYDGQEIGSDSIILEEGAVIGAEIDVDFNISVPTIVGLNNSVGNESLGNMTIETSVKQRIRLGEPVQWKKKVRLSREGNLSVLLPSVAGNVSVNVIGNVSGNRVEQEVSDEKISLGGRFSMTGNLVVELDVRKEGLLTQIWKRVRSAITGNVVEGEDSEEVLELVIEEEGEEFEIEYETPAPYAEEELVSETKKEITIVGPEEVHYNDILAYTELENEMDFGIARLYRTTEGIRERVEIEEFDLNGNSLVDYIEWVVPHLSNQTYELILISKAEHLDSNREFIADVYSEVSEQDGIWLENVSDGEYVRVSFERELDNTKDITLYARAGCHESVLINGVEVPCEIYYKKLELEGLKNN